MNPQTLKWVALQIDQYRVAKGREKEILRNRIYKLLQPHLLSCVRNYLRDRKQYDSDAEVVSVSWDGFVKGLQLYKDVKHEMIIKHFQTCCIRHIRNTYRTVVRRDIPFKESEVDKLYATCPDTTIDGLLLLQSFRSSLPPEYREVFDDTLNGTDRIFRKGPREVMLSEPRYFEAKRCFQIVIEFLVRRG